MFIVRKNILYNTLVFCANEEVMNFNYNIVDRARQLSMDTWLSCGPLCSLCGKEMVLTYADLYVYKFRKSFRRSQWQCSCGGVKITASCQYFNKMIHDFTISGDD